MVRVGDTTCPKCGKELTYYDTVRRVVKTKGGAKRRVYIKRLRCGQCKAYHRELPEFIFPYKHYEAEIIQGVIDGIITPDTFEYEDYPCEATMKHWVTQNLQGLL